MFHDCNLRKSISARALVTLNAVFARTWGESFCAPVPN